MTERKIIAAEITFQTSYYPARKENKLLWLMSLSTGLPGSYLFFSPLLCTDLTTKWILNKDGKKPATYASFKVMNTGKFPNLQHRLSRIPKMCAHSSSPTSIWRWIAGSQQRGGDEKGAALWLRLSESGIAVISVFRCNRSQLPSGVNNNKHKYNRQTRPAGHVCTHYYMHTQMQASKKRKDHISGKWMILNHKHSLSNLLSLLVINHLSGLCDHKKPQDLTVLRSDI